jgi:hypothetical protein
MNIEFTRDKTELSKSNPVLKRAGRSQDLERRVLDNPKAALDIICYCKGARWIAKQISPLLEGR